MTTIEAAPAVASASTSDAERPALEGAGPLLLMAAAFGVLGQQLFFEVGLGINYPLAIALLLAGGWLVRGGRRLSLSDAWLAPAAIVYSVFAAIRADPVIVFLDVLASMGLAAGALAAFGGRRVVARSFGRMFAVLASAASWVAAGAARVLADAGRQMPPSASLVRRAARAAPVLRGLAIAIPIALIFVALFSSADAVFARLVADVFGVKLDFGDAVWRLAFAALLAWLAAGALGLATSLAGAEAASGAPSERSGWRLGAAEALTVVLVIDAVFVIFVALQAAYLFGGLDTLQAAGMTYADYARRGFFELVAVAVLSGGLIVAVDRIARDRTLPLVVAGLGLTLLTAVVLASAVLRLRLYQEAYGWTELRLYVLATIAVVAVGLAGLVATLVTDRVRWIGHVLMAAVLGAGLVLNVIGPARFIAQQNVARVLSPELVGVDGFGGLDTTYATGLGDDAVPELIRALPALDSDEAAYLRGHLADRLAELQRSEDLNAWQAWNLGRAAARDALERAREAGDLP